MDKTQVICEQVQHARDSGGQLQVCGAASKPWMHTVGAPLLSLAEHRGIVTYDPTELVVTVRAGTPLAELDQALAQRGQMLAAECPDFGGRSTIGGALATGWSGSRQAYAGSLRDFVLGVRMINGLGEVLRFGGQVMKNVAGFDIPRLLSGSLGQLGVIADVSLKVVPAPQQEVTLAFACESLQQSRQLARSVLQAGEPLSAASYHAGILRLRFSGRGVTLARLVTELGGELGGEVADNTYWLDLQRLQLPLFNPVVDAAAPPPLYDWNGRLFWSRSPTGIVSRQVAEQTPVALCAGPPALGEAGTMASLQQRLLQAFDPHAVFQPARAAVA